MRSKHYKSESNLGVSFVVGVLFYTNTYYILRIIMFFSKSIALAAVAASVAAVGFASPAPATPNAGVTNAAVCTDFLPLSVFFLLTVVIDGVFAGY